MPKIRCFENEKQLQDHLTSKKLLRLRIVTWNEYVVVGKNAQGYFAAKDECPHARALMSRGHLNNEGHLVCPLHGYVFDTVTGRVLSGGPCNELPIYQLTIDEQGVWLSK